MNKNEEVVEKLAMISGEALKKVLALADEYGIDRDKLYHNYAVSNLIAAETGTFKHFEMEE